MSVRFLFLCKIVVLHQFILSRFCYFDLWDLVQHSGSPCLFQQQFQSGSSSRIFLSFQSPMLIDMSMCAVHLPSAVLNHGGQFVQLIQVISNSLSIPETIHAIHLPNPSLTRLVIPRSSQNNPPPSLVRLIQLNHKPRNRNTTLRRSGNIIRKILNQTVPNPV